MAGSRHAGRDVGPAAAPPHGTPTPVGSPRSALTVGFDGRALASPAGGVRRYVRELFGAMARLQSVRVVATGVPAGVIAPAQVAATAPSLSLPTNAGWMLTGLPLTTRRTRLDVFHAPAYTAPFFSPRPLIVTIHDVSYERHPEWYPYRRDRLRRAFYRRSARTADAIVTDSEFSRREIVAAYGLDPSRIAVVPLAPAPAFSPGPPGSRPDGIPPRFLLHVGDLHRRRNLPVVARALDDLHHRRPDLRDIALVLAGVDRGEAGPLARANGTVLAIGAIDEATLRALYRSAAALVYPSRYEGFGLPILEAMASGLPVLASRASCLPEVAGDAAVLLDPDDPEAWRDAVEQVLDDGAHAERLRARGLVRAAAFSWERTARETVAVYRRVRERR